MISMDYYYHYYYYYYKNFGVVQMKIINEKN